MKRFLFFTAIVLPLCTSAPTAWAGWTYGPRGYVWNGSGYPGATGAGPGWGRTGVRPGFGPGYGVPVAPGYPSYGYSGYPPVQVVYVVPAPAAYGQMSPALTLPPNSGPGLTPGLSPYTPSVVKQPYRPPPPTNGTRGAARAVPNNSRELNEAERRANRLSEELTRVRRERDEAQMELAMWTALSVSREQVKAFQGQLAELQAHNSSLVRRNGELEGKLSWYLGPEREVTMPVSLNGRVLAVDPKYSFVVLNIGEKQGVARNGKLLVNRNGNLVGKVRVTTVNSDSSIANILQNWKLAEVMEGDQVIHQ